MRILVASASYPTPEHPSFLGGAETFSVQLCEALAERGNEVCVVRSGSAFRAWSVENLNGVEVATMPIHNLYSPWESHSPRAYMRAAWHFIEDHSTVSSDFDRLLYEFQPDILHTNSLYGLTTAIWRKAKARDVPVIHTLHDYYLTCARSSRFVGGERCASSCLACTCLTVGRRRATSLVDTIVSVSDRTLAIHQQCGLFDGGVRKVTIRNPPPSPKAAVAPISIKGEKVTFGFIGRPSVEKGIFDLLSAFHELPKGLARLLVAGSASDDLNSRMRKVAGGSDVEFVGFVRSDNFFPQIDILVVPSIWEDPCPMVIGESFAHCRPVVGARRGGIPELIDDNSGWLYEPYADDLGKLLTAIAADRSSVVAKSRYLSKSRSERDFDDLVTDYLSAYENTIAAFSPNQVL